MQTIYYDLRDTKGQQKEIEDKISAAAKILREGGLVGIPTETVYGLGADGSNPAAVRRIFEVKGRPQDNPLILHVTGAQWLPRYCADIPPVAYTLARKFWPGPLTMVLKRQPTVPDETTAGLDTVGVRCPNHPVTLAIIREAGMAIAAPSANTSGRPSCTSAQDVLEDVGGRIDMIIDGGSCAVGVESTVLDLTQEPPRLLRPGGLPVEDIERLIGHIDVDRAVAASLRYRRAVRSLCLAPQLAVGLCSPCRSPRQGQRPASAPSRPRPAAVALHARRHPSAASPDLCPPPSPSLQIFYCFVPAPLGDPAVTPDLLHAL